MPERLSAPSSFLGISKVEVILQFCLDTEKSRVWYEDFLGLKAVAYGGGLFALGGTALHLAPGAQGTGRGGTGVYFHVDDVDSIKGLV